MSVSSSTHEGPAASGAGSVRNQIVVVTGASSGLGFETAKQLAIQGAEVVMICRNRDRGEKARAQVARVATGTQPVLMLADVAVQADIRRVADEVKSRYDHVDILINNDGGLYRRRKQLTLKGAASDDSLAGEIWTISESQSGIDPERSAVAVVSKRSRNDG